MAVSIVFGASGAIGRFLLPRLLAGGGRVVAISRAPRASSESVRWIAGALPDAMPDLPSADALISAGPLDAFAAWFAKTAFPCARIVAIGSMSAETKRDSADARERDLAARLVAAETQLHDAAAARGIACTILRPTLIWGAGIDKSLTPIARFAARTRVFPSIVPARGLRQPVHADDLAAACARLAKATAMPQPTYRVGGAERLAFATMMARVRASLGRTTAPLPIPAVLAGVGLSIARRLPPFRGASGGAIRRLGEDLVVDDAPARADFGWSPRGFDPVVSDWFPERAPREP